MVVFQVVRQFKQTFFRVKKLPFDLPSLPWYDPSLQKTKKGPCRFKKGVMP